MTEYLVAALVAIIETGLVIYKYYVNQIDRNPICGGVMGVLPLCPITGIMTQVYQREGESCLISTACEPGLTCQTGRCHRRFHPLPPGRRSRFPRDDEDIAQWCATDFDCEGFELINPTSGLSQRTALCVNGKCRPTIVRYGSILAYPLNQGRTCNILSCPIGACVCIESTGGMILGYGNVSRKYHKINSRFYDDGPSFSIDHPPFGFEPRSVLNGIIGFNSEPLNRSPDINQKKITRMFIITLVLLGLSIITLVMSVTATGRRRVILLALTIMLQILFLVFLFAKWS